MSRVWIQLLPIFSRDPAILKVSALARTAVRAISVNDIDTGTETETKLCCTAHPYLPDAFLMKKTDVSFNYFLSFLNQGWPQVLMKLKKIVETKIWLDIFFHPEDVFIIFCYFPKVKKVCSGSSLKWFKSSLSLSLSLTHTHSLSLSFLSFQYPSFSVEFIKKDFLLFRGKK